MSSTGYSDMSSYEKSMLVVPKRLGVVGGCGMKVGSFLKYLLVMSAIVCLANASCAVRLELPEGPPVVI